MLLRVLVVVLALTIVAWILILFDLFHLALVPAVAMLMIILMLAWKELGNMKFKVMLIG